MALISRRFAGIPELEACAVDDGAHLLSGSQGRHVALVQQALIDLGEQIESGPSGTYGPDTEAAVSTYKTDRQILNFAGQIDPIVGRKTIAALDAEIERFDAAAGSAQPRARLHFAGLDDAVETSLGFEEVVELVETALQAGELIRLPDDAQRVLNPQQLVSVERI